MESRSTSEEYTIASRRIAGAHAERLSQIDAAIQELLDIKRRECADDHPDVGFLAAPRRSHWLGMTVAILVMLVILVLLLGVRPAHAQTTDGNPAPQRPDWSNTAYVAVHDGGTSTRQPTALVGLVWWIGNKTGAR